MKKVVLFIIAMAGAYYAFNQPDSALEYNAPQTSGRAPVAQNDVQWRAGQQVSGSGTVERVLSDDNDGSRHQRFILRLSSGRTLLVAHNIDLAPRVSSLSVGDTVSFYGEYEPNDRGGVIHWTHHDPQGRHVGGWLEHKGQRYQ
jgi:hypothetical protein